MEIGLVGAPNSGKSTFFNAATLQNAETGNRPFVTIKPNQGTAFVKVECPHKEIGQKCDPQHGYCIDGWRFVPIVFWDVAGLVPDAWQGKGLGNQFLNDIMQAKALIHVLDASGSTNTHGEVLGEGCFDPSITVEFLEKEISYWIRGIIQKNWKETAKRATAGNIVEAIANQLSGLGVTLDDVKHVLSREEFSGRPVDWSDETLLVLAEEIRKKSKPMVIAANKADLKSGKQNVGKLKAMFSDETIVPTSAEAELALRKAHEHGLIHYVPGSIDFKELQPMPEKQKKCLEFIRENVLQQYGGTGVQEIINKTAFELLDLMVVFPVQDSNKWVSSKGHLLPDAHILKKGSTALDLAFKIHTDIGNKFVAAINCRTQQKIGKDTELKHLDVVKIITR
ncbi:MAG: redox-regulated ATPase YchF [Candidatus Diapherotrites archaeon]